MKTFTETNTSAITTSATGAGSITVGDARPVSVIAIQVPGYVAVPGTVSGQTVDFQLYQQSAATGALTEPAAAVTINANTLIITYNGF